ncbi:MAG: hypothetical protein FWF10_11200 [Clostridiales bacterium]|nr:hypothetical protein [Clostridiales bacterium]
MHAHTLKNRIDSDVGVPQGDAYSFGAWMRSTAPAMNNSGNGTVNAIKITVLFYTVSGTTKTLRNSVDAFFGADTEDWQYVCGVAIASGTYNTIEVALCANYSAGDTYFDGLQLYREEFSQGYKYDANRPECPRRPKHGDEQP